MEELAKLEAERGTHGYISDGENTFADGRKRLGGNGGVLQAGTDGADKASMKDILGAANERKGKRERVASNEMCTFLILNISSLQLIPVNMIAYRSQYGSVNPVGIIASAIVATFISTLMAVVYCKGKSGRQKT